MGPRAGLDGCEKYRPFHRNLFLILLCFVCTLSVLVSLSSLSCVLPFYLYLQRTTQTSMPPEEIRARNPTRRAVTGIGRDSIPRQSSP